MAPSWLGTGREAIMVAQAQAPTALRHLLTVAQIDRPLLAEIFARARALSGTRDRRCSGKIMATLFYEPSTRTRLSFESAMHRLGGAVIGTEAAHEFSSAIKGESLQDTIRVVNGYADIIVLRHNLAGSAQAAAAVATVPLINAGDGGGEHPTQALIDLYTIEAELGRIDGLHIALCGDLRHGRTARSLALILSLFPGVKLSFVAPAVVQMGADICQKLNQRGIDYAHYTAIEEIARDVDVVYQTRIQKERFTDQFSFALAQAATKINAEVMAMLPARAIVLHPLPRVDEISSDVDGDPRAAYFRQAAHGVDVRMALIDLLLAEMPWR